MKRYQLPIQDTKYSKVPKRGGGAIFGGYTVVYTSKKIRGQFSGTRYQVGLLHIIICWITLPADLKNGFVNKKCVQRL